MTGYVVRDTMTRRYWAGDLRWSPDQVDARVFEFATIADMTALGSGADPAYYEVEPVFVNDPAVFELAEARA